MNEVEKNSKNEECEEESEGRNIKDYLEIIILVSSFVIYAIIALYVLLNPNQWTFELWLEFEEYKKPLLTVLPIIIATISIFIIFYLGKLHDYKRDFIKQYGIFTELKLQTERKFSSAGINQHDELIQALENDDEYYEESNELFKSDPKDFFMTFGFILLMFILSYVFLLKDTLRSNEMLYVVISIIFACGIVPWAIRQSEKQISLHDEDLKDITQDIAYVKSYLN